MAPAVAPSCLFKALLLRHRLTLPKVNEFWRVPGRSSSSLLDVQPIAWLDLVEACKGAVFLGLVEACKGPRGCRWRQRKPLSFGLPCSNQSILQQASLSPTVAEKNTLHLPLTVRLPSAVSALGSSGSDNPKFSRRRLADSPLSRMTRGYQRVTVVASWRRRRRGESIMSTVNGGERQRRERECACRL